MRSHASVKGPQLLRTKWDFVTQFLKACYMGSPKLKLLVERNGCRRGGRVGFVNRVGNQDIFDVTKGMIRGERPKHHQHILSFISQVRVKSPGRKEARADDRVL